MLAALPKSAARKAKQMKRQWKLPENPKTLSPKSKKIHVSAKYATNLKMTSALCLVSSDTLGSMYRRADIPVKKIVTIPLKCKISAIIKGMYMSRMYKLNSRTGVPVKSKCLNTSATKKEEIIPKAGDPNASRRNSMANIPASPMSVEVSSTPIRTKCEKDRNNTIATASLSADSPKTKLKRCGSTFLACRTPNTLTVSVAAIKAPNVKSSSNVKWTLSPIHPARSAPHSNNPVTKPERVVPMAAKDTMGLMCRKNNSRLSSYPELNNMGGNNAMKKISPENCKTVLEKRV
mmetsp:Transcript_24588/g.40236  ORF Transcript_24588/g.40236 Transcript_24588/m.40236 type:complete len:291 (-) Transcript_24588:626-1498(-)